METTKMLPPWVVYRNKVNALFEDDKEITVGEVTEIDDEGNYEFTISTANASKFKALNSLIEKEVGIANITLFVSPVYTGTEAVYDEASLLEDLFEGNSTFNSIRKKSSPFGEVTYCLFEPEVIQYPADNTADYYGLESDLAQNIASEIFETHHVNFCTDTVWETNNDNDTDTDIDDSIDEDTLPEG